MKRILTLALCLALVVSLFFTLSPSFVFAETKETKAEEKEQSEEKEEEKKEDSKEDKKDSEDEEEDKEPEGPGANGKEIPLDEIKIGFVHVSDPSDMGYTYNHNRGTEKMMKDLGIKKDQVINKFNIAEGAECETAVRELA